MNAPAKTSTVVGALFLLAAGWEAWTLINAAPGDAISEVVWQATYATPLVPFIGGFFAGHFWFVKTTCVHCGKRPWARD